MAPDLRAGRPCTAPAATIDASSPAPFATISWQQKTIAGSGGIFETLSNHAIAQLAYPIFNIGLGVSPGAVGLALALPRFWDGLIAPLAGSASDRTHSRFGRRRPHMLAGALGSGLIFAALWWLPQGMSPGYYFWHFLLGSLLFFTAAAFFVVPWQALLIEISPDYHERTRMQAARSLLATLGALALPWLFWATQRPIFSSPPEGARYVGLAVGALLVLSGLLPALLLREPAATRTPPPAQLAQLTFRRGLRSALANRPFLIVVALMTLFGPGLLITEALGLYVNIYHVHGGDPIPAAHIAGIQGTLLYGAKFLWVPVIAALATRWGKKPTLFLCFALTLFACAAKWFCYTPTHPWLQLAVPILQTPGMAGAWVILHSMLGDTVDWDEARTGEPRAGLLLALAQWIRKTGSTVAFFIGGQILLWSGFDAARRAAQDPQALLWLRLAYPIIPFVCILAALALLLMYPITEHTARETRRQIDSRRPAS